MDKTATRLAEISQWLDDSIVINPDTLGWVRISKCAEEVGEAIQAYIGATGVNPRKGVEGSLNDVVKELADVAITALCAIEHFTGNRGESLELLNTRTSAIHARAGLE